MLGSVRLESEPLPQSEPRDQQHELTRLQITHIFTHVFHKYICSAVCGLVGGCLKDKSLYHCIGVQQVDADQFRSQESSQRHTVVNTPKHPL